MSGIRHVRPVFLRLYPLLGIAGGILVSAVVVVVALTYTGRLGEPYSALNHFISELGQWGVSRNAWLFNAGLIVGGILFMPFCVGLGIHLETWAGWAAAAAGILAGGFCAAVGVFPMNHLGPHAFVAMWFFRCGLATTLLFGIAFLAQREARISRWGGLISLVAVAAFAAFLVLAPLSGVSGNSPLDPSFYLDRPRVWVLAASEWAVFAATILWFLGVGLLVTLRDRRSGTPSGKATARR